MGFIQRKHRKIHPLDLLKAFCMLMPQGPSLRALALALNTLSGEVVAKRIGPSWVEFLKQMLALLLCRRFDTLSTESLFSAFTRVLLHDSSALPLPAELALYCPGAGNQSGRNAQAKIQAIFDTKSRSYVCRHELPRSAEGRCGKAAIGGSTRARSAFSCSAGPFSSPM